MKLLALMLFGSILTGCATVTIIDSDKGCTVSVNEPVQVTYTSERCEVTVGGKDAQQQAQ